MSARKPKRKFFISALDDAQSAHLHVDSPHTRSTSYRLAYQDEEFILRDELRPVRLQLELLKPELILQENHIESTVVVYGSARIPDPQTAQARLVSAEAEYRQNKDDDALKQKVNIARRALANSKYYEEARKLGGLISSNTGKDALVVITGVFDDFASATGLKKAKFFLLMMGWKLHPCRPDHDSDEPRGWPPCRSSACAPSSSTGDRNHRGPQTRALG